MNRFIFKNKGRFLRKVCFALAVVILFSGCEKDDEDTKTNKGYSFTPPSSWVAGEAAGGIETFTGPADGNFRPNMNIVTETFDGTLSKYVDANINGLTLMFGVTSPGRSPFQTSSGLSGEKLVYSATVGGNNLRYVQYCVSPKSGSKTYAVITGAGLASYNNKYDASFETAAKSFAWK
jgi:hypothetical protein